MEKTLAAAGDGQIDANQLCWVTDITFCVADTVFYIQKGRVKVVVLSEQGKEAVVAILEPGQFFGEGCLIGNPLRISTATALEGCACSPAKRAEILHTLYVLSVEAEQPN